MPHEASAPMQLRVTRGFWVITFEKSRRRPYRLPTYNGFTHEQRVATLSVQKAAAASGAWAHPTRCSICGFSDLSDPRGRGYIYAHLEDYGRPLHIHPTCRPCHVALHARFDNPARWLAVSTRHGHAGSWFRLLTMSPAHQAESFWDIYPQDLPPPSCAD